MKIDRKQFLLLTAAMHAAGCTGHTPVEAPEQDAMGDMEDPVFNEVEPGDPVAGNRLGDGDVIRGPISKSGPTVEDGYYGAPVHEGLYAGPTQEGALRAAPIQEFGMVSNPYAGPKIHDACDDFDPPPGPHCESFSDNAEMCTTVYDKFDAKTAKRFSTCLDSKSGTKAICGFNGHTSCMKKAFAGKKSSASSKKLCKDTAAMCKKHRQTMPEGNAVCAGAVESVDAAHRNRLTSCIAEFCEVSSCLWYMD